MPEAAVPVALVTGARKGIGRYLAEHLLARGYQVEGLEAIKSRAAAAARPTGRPKVIATMSSMSPTRARSRRYSPRSKSVRVASTSW